MAGWVVAMLSRAAVAGDVEWRAEAGRELSTADSRGPINVGVRQEAWSVELLTDTVDARWTPSGDRGRGWVGVRGQALFAQVLEGRWIDGAPAPEAAVWASHVGPTAGVVRYLPHGLYAGVQGTAELWSLGAVDGGLDLDAPLPAGVDLPGSPFWQVQPEGIAGVWSSDVQAWVAAGAVVREDRVIPEARLQAVARISVVEGSLWAGLASNADDVTRTRLGGLNPYVVPLAGAFWGEFWVEDYVAARLSPGLRTDRLVLAALVDAAWFDGQTAAGFGGLARVQRHRLFAETAVGVSPWIERAPGIAPGSLWLRVGVDWGPVAATPE